MMSFVRRWFWVLALALVGDLNRESMEKYWPAMQKLYLNKKVQFK